MAAAHKRKGPEAQQTQNDTTNARRKARQNVEKLAKELLDENERLENKLVDKVDAAYKEKLGIAEPESLQGTGFSSEEREELQQLASLSLNEIEALPQEKRELVWNELARQIVESPEFADGIQNLIDGCKQIAGRIKDFLPRLQRLAEPANNFIQEKLPNLFTDENVKAFQVFKTLSPYIEAEADAHPEKYGDNATEPASARELIAAAAHRARADGKEIPPLAAEEPEQLQFEFSLDKEEIRRKRIEEARERREMAQQEGALLTANTRLATIADKEGLGFAYFTSEVCKLLPAGIENFILDDQGRINLYDLTGGDKPIREVLQEVDKLHTAFLMWLLGLAWNNSDIRETNSGNAIMPVYLPSVLNEMQIDPRPRERDSETGLIKKRDTDKSLPELRLDKFMSFLNPLNKVAAWFGGDLYAIAGFDHYSRESETVYIRTPYMFRLVEYAKLHATKHGAIKNIFHADIMTENQTAVEIANRIAMGLITRGVTREDSSTYQNDTLQKPIKKRTTKTAPDGTKMIEELTFAPEAETTVTKSRTDENGITVSVTGTPRKKEKTFTFGIRFSSLIADCPQLQREIEEIRSMNSKDKSQRINKKLKDTFTAAIRIIMEKSEIPKYYKELTIRTARFDTFKAPTNSTLSDRMIITHHGKNPDFSERKDWDAV